MVTFVRRAPFRPELQFTDAERVEPSIPFRLLPPETPIGARTLDHYVGTKPRDGAWSDEPKHSKDSQLHNTVKL